MMCRMFAGRQAGRQASKQAGVVEVCSAKEALQHAYQQKLGPTLTCPLSHMHASSETIIIIIIIIIRPSEKKSWHHHHQQQQTHSIHSLLHIFFVFFLVFTTLYNDAFQLA
jgi:p-aminobenzoyl-glutamate transporter AbgT